MYSTSHDKRFTQSIDSIPNNRKCNSYEILWFHCIQLPKSVFSASKNLRFSVRISFIKFAYVGISSRLRNEILICKNEILICNLLKLVKLYHEVFNLFNCNCNKLVFKCFSYHLGPFKLFNCNKLIFKFFLYQLVPLSCLTVTIFGGF